MPHQLDLAAVGRIAHRHVDAADRGEDVGEDAIALGVAGNVVEQHRRVADLALIDVDDAADLALALGAARCASPRRPLPSRRARRAGPASTRWTWRRRGADRRWCSWRRSSNSLRLILRSARSPSSSPRRMGPLSHCICRIPFPPLSSLVIPECLANAPPPGFERRRARLPCDCAPERVRVARDAGVRVDPRASMRSRHRGSPDGKCRKSAVSSSVPRAVFEACSVRPPVVGLFQDPSRCGALPWGLNHRCGTSMRPARWRGVTIALPRVPLLRSCRYGTSRLGPPGRGVRLCTPHFAFPGHRPRSARLTRPRPSRGSRRSHDKSARRGRG